MKSRIYYGEYSLYHWIHLLISKNIILPDYQRLFVWNHKKVKNLIESIKQDEFIPPITIGVFKKHDRNVNYILDGQQRLTSILLSLFKVFPKKGKELEEELFRPMNENDDEQDDSVDKDSFLNWTFKELTKLGSTYEEIKESIPEELYEQLDVNVSTGFFHNHYLGFSYIVPSTKDEKEQQKYYSSVFRNINIRGTSLNEMESRESLYFLDPSKLNFFKPDLQEYSIANMAERNRIDFVRYMALLSQYKKDGKESHLAKGYGTRAKIETYYEMYIYATVGERNSSTFTDFTTIFPDGNYQHRIDRLKHTMHSLSVPKQFGSIIEVDCYMFGIIYHIVILNQEIDTDKQDEIRQEINRLIESFKANPGHKKSPASLKYLRQRIACSISTYHRYVIPNEA